ncbi:unnamed protein product [Phytophthora fragariaefolia]|uniref:Unnamed protein product n=1 Tax=Phytophthora fragariaefolia TaxID=1490495 RepID=A0A9W7D6G3_9STRA|nr:unnamed protein product [Phytophthora fragariaefolia]
MEPWLADLQTRAQQEGHVKRYRQGAPDNALPKAKTRAGLDNATQDRVGPDNATQTQGRDAPITARDQGQDRRTDGSRTRLSQ